MQLQLTAGRWKGNEGNKGSKRTLNGSNGGQRVGVALDELQGHGARGGWGPGDGDWLSSSNAREVSVGEGVRAVAGLGCGHDGEGAGQESGDEAHGVLGLGVVW